MFVKTTKAAPQKTPLEMALGELADIKPSKKVNALKSIAKMGMAIDPALEVDKKVFSLIDDLNPKVQENALLCLATMPAAVTYLDSVLKKVHSDVKAVKCAAIEAIGMLGDEKSIMSIEPCLDSTEPDVVVAACKAMGTLGASSSADKLMAKLSGQDADVMEAACMALANMDHGVDPVAKLLSDKEARIRLAAVNGLKTMSHSAQHADAVAGLIKGGNGLVRMAAADFFLVVGAAASSSCEMLAGLLDDQDAGVVAAAATALGGIGKAAVSKADKFVELLKDTREDTSTLALANAGIVPKAPPTLSKVACAAAMAIGMVKADDKAPELVECLKSKDIEMREASLTALGNLGKPAAKFEPKIIDLLEDPVPVVVAAACGALGAFAAATGPTSTAAEAVGKLLLSREAVVRAAACKALSLMSEEAEVFLESLVKLLGDRSWTVQAEAVKAVASCGEQGSMFAPNICRKMLGGHPAVRVAAIEALPLMGERGRAFQEEVESLWDDPQVSEAVAMCLDKFAKQDVGMLEEDDGIPVELGFQAPRSGAPANVGLLFPGQGSQYVKMFSDVKDLPKVAAMLKKSRAILGFDVLSICLNGPEERLEKTKICQPAMYIAGLAGVELLRVTKPALASNMKAVAGFSLGEYTALTVAGVFDFETGLKLVKLRGEAMQEAAEASPQKMLSIAGLERDVVARLCEEAKFSPTDICSVANFLFPAGFSVAGSLPAIEKLQELATKEPGCMQAKQLKTSGAFHSEFMKPAKQRLTKALLAALPEMKPPQCDVYMNVTGKKIGPGTSTSEIVDLLASQLTSCVEWDSCMKAMIGDGIGEFYECGPMKQLRAMMKRIDKDMWEKTTNISV